MERDLLFGAAYYAEYMPYDRVEIDIKMMKEANMNVIRIAESTWSTLEPADGVFCFDYIDKVLEVAEHEEVSVIIGTPTYAIPSWLANKAEDVMVTTKDGQANYGRRQQMNIASETFRFYAERVIRKLMEKTAHRSCVIGFQIDNETKHYGTAGLLVQKEFVEYLKHRFITTDELNRVFGLAYWSNSIASWEDFPDMSGCIHAGLSAEFEKFQRNLASSYLEWQADIVKEYKKEEQFVTHNLDFEWKKFGADIAQDGYSYGVQPDICHLEASKCLTIAGTDIYHPTQDDLTGMEIAFCGDSIRSLKQDNYLVLECQAQAFKYWTPYPGQLRLHAYSHLASGAKGLMYWNWHSIHNGYETYWKGVLSHDLQKNPVYEEAGRFGKEWKDNKATFLSIKKENKVAIVINNSSLTALKWFPIDRELSYNDVVRWVYSCFYEMNIECDIVDEDAICLADYQMVVTPALYSVKESFLVDLKEFVARGGVLLSTFKSFVSNEYLTVFHDKQPHILHECFGVSYNQFTEPVKTSILGKKVEFFAELLKVEGGKSIANYDHTYWKEYAGITQNAYELGQAFYIGCYTDKCVLKEVIKKAMAHITTEETNVQTSWPVIVRSGKNEVGNLVHYVLHYSEETEAFECPYNLVEDLLTGNKYRKGDNINLKDWDVLILEEREE